MLTDVAGNISICKINASHWIVCLRLNDILKIPCNMQKRVEGFFHLAGTFFSTLRDYIKHVESSNQYLIHCEIPSQRIILQNMIGSF